MEFFVVAAQNFKSLISFRLFPLFAKKLTTFYGNRLRANIWKPMQMQIHSAGIGVAAFKVKPYTDGDLYA